MKPKPPAKLGQRRGSVGSAAGRSSAARAGSAPRALWIGVGTADISPPHPELLTPTGMGRRVRTRGVLDPLRVEAMAISVGGELAFVTTSDLRTIPMEKGAPEESGLGPLGISADLPGRRRRGEGNPAEDCPSLRLPGESDPPQRGAQPLQFARCVRLLASGEGGPPQGEPEDPERLRGGLRESPGLDSAPPRSPPRRSTWPSPSA